MASIADNNTDINVCFICHKVDNLKLCSRCRKPGYYLCSKECQIGDWKSHKWTCSANVEIKSAGNSGMGIFSRKTFEVGDIIVKEKPLVKIPQHMLRSRKATLEPEKIRKAEEFVAAKKPHVQQLLMAFSNSHKDSIESEVVGIIRTNSIPLGQSTYGRETEEAGLFPLICRANHACNANARYVWRHDFQREFLVAQRKISVGAEITVEYGDFLKNRDARQKTLLEKFNFSCYCDMCTTGYTDEIDEHMFEIRELIDQVPLMAQSNPALALKMSEKTLRLMELANVDKPVNTGMVHYDAFQVALASNNKRKAKLHIQKCIGLAYLQEGAGTPEAEKYKVKLAQLL